MAGTIAEYSMTTLRAIPYSATADADGVVVTMPAGTVKCIYCPGGGAVTAKWDSFTPVITVADGTWSPEITFEPDGTTTHTITLAGSNITTKLIVYINSRICPTTTISVP